MLASAVTLIITKPTQHPYLRSWLSGIVSIVLILPIFIDARFAILVPIIGAAVAVFCSSKWASIPVLVSFVLSLLIAVTPNGANVAVLEARYSDSFNYLVADEYYSDRLSRAVKYNRTFGDNYQSILYEDSIIRHVKSLFPERTVFGTITVDEVQTKGLFFGWSDFYEHVLPTVTVQAKIPFIYEGWDLSRLPKNIHVEVLL